MSLKTNQWRKIARQQLVTVIHAKGPSTVAELAVLVDVPPEAIRRRIRRRIAYNKGYKRGVDGVKAELISELCRDLCRSGVCFVAERVSSHLYLYGLVEQNDNKR